MPDRRRRSATRSTRCSDRRRPGGAAASAATRTATWRSADGRAAASLRPHVLPALHAVNDRVGWVSQGALELHRPAALGAAGRAVRRAHVLRPVLASTPAPRGCCTSARTWPARRNGAGELVAGLGPGGRPVGATARRRGTPHRAWACASGRRRRWWWRPARRRGPRSWRRRRPPIVAARPGRPAGARPSRPPVRPSPRPASPGSLLLRRVGRVDPASLADYRAEGGYEALRRAIELGPAGRDPRGVRLPAPGPGRRGLPDRTEVGGRGRAARAPPPPRVQRRRVRAGHVQGPGHHGGRSVRGGRGHDRRRLRHRMRARLRLPAGRVPAGPPAARARHRRGPPPRLPRRRT